MSNSDIDQSQVEALASSILSTLDNTSPKTTTAALTTALCRHLGQSIAETSTIDFRDAVGRASQYCTSLIEPIIDEYIHALTSTYPYSPLSSPGSTFSRNKQEAKQQGQEGLSDDYKKAAKVFVHTVTGAFNSPHPILTLKLVTLYFYVELHTDKEIAPDTLSPEEAFRAVNNFFGTAFTSYEHNEAIESWFETCRAESEARGSS